MLKRLATPGFLAGFCIVLFWGRRILTPTT
jgi:hypothetical protein